MTSLKTLNDTRVNFGLFINKKQE